MHPDWVSIALLGSLHGVNPAMGWLFAVSLGLQARSTRAVWTALAPMALGHALAVVVAVAAAAVLGVLIPPSLMKWMSAVALVSFGVWHMRSHSHPRWSVGGMCVGPRQLTTWSFLVSSAHGAGVMVLPFVLGASAASAPASMHSGVGGHAAHLASIGLSSDHTTALLATAVHTAGYFAVSGVIAWVVYERLGLRFLRTAWINMNVIWAAALFVTAAATIPVRIF